MGGFDPYADPEDDPAVAQQARLAKGQEQWEASVRWLMKAGPRGRHVAHQILEQTGWDQSDGGDNDTNAQFRNAGRRDIGCWFRNTIKQVCGRDTLLLMEEEAHERDSDGSGG